MNNWKWVRAILQTLIHIHYKMESQSQLDLNTPSTDKGKKLPPKKIVAFENSSSNFSVVDENISRNILFLKTQTLDLLDDIHDTARRKQPNKPIRKFFLGERLTEPRQRKKKAVVVSGPYHSTKQRPWHRLKGVWKGRGKAPAGQSPSQKAVRWSCTHSLSNISMRNMTGSVLVRLGYLECFLFVEMREMVIK